MILVTVGTQLPFDRLVEAMDEIAVTLDEPVVAQIGVTSYVPRHIDWKASLTPAEFDAAISRARLLVSHAGTGSILAAQRHAIPVILMPRRAALGEHRNDHQLATVAGLAHRPGLHVANDTEELAALVRRHNLEPAQDASVLSSRQTLIGNLQAFLNA